MSHFHVENLKKNGSLFKCKSWIRTHQLLLLPKYNKTQFNSLLSVSMLFLFTFISTLTNIRQINWIFYNHMNKKGYFYSHENIISYGIPLLPRLFIPHYQNTWKFQCKLRDKYYSLMLRCLKINYINLRTK